MNRENGGQQTGSKSPAAAKRRLFACGVGNFYNDLVCKVMYSFGLVYYMKVIELTSFQAGLVLVLGELSSFIANIIFGYLCDNVDLPGLSRRIGRRKAWHLIGTALVSVSVMFAFSRCLPCTSSSSSWVAFGYYAVMYFTACFGYGAVELSHITTIPEVAQSDDETVILNSMRTGFSYFGGICAYGVAWVILGQNSNGSLNPDNWKEFTKINAILTGLGLVFVAIFHIGTEEPKHKKRSRLVSIIFNTAGMYSVALIFGINTDEDLQRQSAQAMEGANTRRKKSSATMALRKFSSYIMPFDAKLNTDSGTFSSAYERRRARYSAPEIRRMRNSVQEVSTLRHKSTAAVPTVEEGRTQNDCRNASLFEETHHRKIPISTLKPPDLLSVSEDPSTKIERGKVEKEREDETAHNSKLEDLNNVINTCHVELEEPGKRKSIKEWLKDPQLYKVTTLFVCAYSLESFAYAYLALYLTDHLQYNKEATAYFSLVFLVSGLVGTATTKKLDEKIGRTKTNCLASSLAALAAVWLYFVPESTKQMVYAPIALIGCSVSGMFVMALSFVADVISDEKESSGFVYSFVSASHKLTCGSLLMVIQNFYPSASSPNRGPYIRLVFAVVLGILALTGMVVMLIYECCEAATCTETPADQINQTMVLKHTPEDRGARHTLSSATNTDADRETTGLHTNL